MSAIENDMNIIKDIQSKHGEIVELSREFAGTYEWWQLLKYYFTRLLQKLMAKDGRTLPEVITECLTLELEPKELEWFEARLDDIADYATTRAEDKKRPISEQCSAADVSADVKVVKRAFETNTQGLDATKKKEYYRQRSDRLLEAAVRAQEQGFEPTPGTSKMHTPETPKSILKPSDLKPKQVKFATDSENEEVDMKEIGDKTKREPSPPPNDEAKAKKDKKKRDRTPNDPPRERPRHRSRSPTPPPSTSRATPKKTPSGKTYSTSEYGSSSSSRRSGSKSRSRDDSSGREGRSSTRNTPASRRKKQLEQKKKLEQINDRKRLALINNQRREIKEKIDDNDAKYAQEQAKHGAKKEALLKSLRIITTTGSQVRQKIEESEDDDSRTRSKSRSRH